MDGMPREATQELGGRETPSVMECEYSATESEEVAPEMRGALDLAITLLRIEGFAEDPERDASFEGRALHSYRVSLFQSNASRPFGRIY